MLANRRLARNASAVSDAPHTHADSLRAPNWGAFDTAVCRKPLAVAAVRDSLWDFNRFWLGKPCQKRLSLNRQLLMLIDLNMNPSPQAGFIVAPARSFLKPRRSGRSGTSQIVSFEHAKASAALAASCKRANRKLSSTLDHRQLRSKPRPRARLTVSLQNSERQSLGLSFLRHSAALVDHCPLSSRQMRMYRPLPA
jgi:hypothetical protein